MKHANCFFVFFSGYGEDGGLERRVVAAQDRNAPFVFEVRFHIECEGGGGGIKRQVQRHSSSTRGHVYRRARVMLVWTTIVDPGKWVHNVSCERARVMLVRTTIVDLKKWVQKVLARGLQVLMSDTAFI